MVSRAAPWVILALARSGVYNSDTVIQWPRRSDSLTPIDVQLIKSFLFCCNSRKVQWFCVSDLYLAGSRVKEEVEEEGSMGTLRA